MYALRYISEIHFYLYNSYIQVSGTNYEIICFEKWILFENETHLFYLEYLDKITSI